jgi:hypothetical protein
MTGTDELSTWNDRGNGSARDEEAALDLLAAEAIGETSSAAATPEPLRDAATEVEPPAESETGAAAGPDPAQDFVEMAASWLNRRPEKRILLERLCRLVLADGTFSLPPAGPVRVAADAGSLADGDRPGAEDA